MMSEQLVKIIKNCETGEEQVIPLTAEEIAEMEARAAEFAAQEAARAAAEAEKAAAKANAEAKLAALGLTPEEIAAITK
jgi:hypothetical protein